MSEPRTPSVQTDDPRDVEWAREFIGRIEGIAEEWQGGGPFPGLSVSYEALRRKLREVRMGQASRDDVLEEAAKAAEATDPVHYGVGWSGTPEHPGGSESYSKPRHESMRCALAIRLLKSKQPTEHPQAAEPLIGRPPEQQRAMDAARDAALAFVPGTRQPTGQPPSDVSPVGKVEKLGDLWCVYFPERAPYTFSTEEAAARMLNSLRAQRSAKETVIETAEFHGPCPTCGTIMGDEAAANVRMADVLCAHDDPMVLDGQTAWCGDCGALFGAGTWRLPKPRTPQGKDK